MKITVNAILILFYITIGQNLPAFANFQTSASNIFDFKNELAPFESYDQLIDNPESIETSIFKEVINKEKILNTLFDFHVIYNISIDKLFSKVLDSNNSQNIFPRIIYSQSLFSGNNLWEPQFQEVKTQFKFGFYKANYHYILYKIPLKNEDGSYLIKWNLFDSVDDKFAFIYGSWYMKEIVLNNKKYTYIRMYSHYGMKNFYFYTEKALKIGGKNNSLAFLEALKNAAE